MNLDAFKPFINHYGLIVMANGDAGDAPMKTSFFSVGQYFANPDAIDRARLRSAYDKALAEISVGDGLYIRDPDVWKDPKDMSRDNTWPIMAATGLMGLVGRFDALVRAMCRNYSRAQNGDVYGPDIWGAVIRLKRLWYLWPLLWLFDVPHIVNSLILCFWKGREPGAIRKFCASHLGMWFMVMDYKPHADGSPNSPHGPDNVGDDNNHVLHLWVCNESLGTPVSWLARTIYVLYRPRNYGCYVKQALDDANARHMYDDFPNSKSVHPVIGAFRWYWRASQGAPPMADLWESLIVRLL